MQPTMYTFMERRNMYSLTPLTRLGHLVLNSISVDSWEDRNM
jgi:hypothetical protein